MNNRETVFFFAKVISFSFIVGSFIPIVGADDGLDATRILLSGCTGVIIGSGCLMLEFSFLSNRSVRWLRTVPIIAIVALRAIAYGIIIVFGLVAPSLLFSGRALWLDLDFVFSFWLSFGIAVGIAMSVELFQLLGKEATIALFTGRYRRPRLENRIVMYADLLGSTALAEKLGDLRFHKLLSDVAYDLDKPIASAGGETHRYVGDAIIITWPMNKSANFEHCLHCAKAMIGTLADKSEDYTARYGQAMRIRIALHCGPVAAGEIGAWRKEIALLGDTMNSAARISSAARESGSDIVISEAVRTHLPNDLQSSFTSLPDYAAHGKHDLLKLWAL